MLELLLPVFGFFIGAVAALVGIGGGVLIVPLLTLLYGFLPANAAGTSLTTIIFTATASTLNFARQKRTFCRTGLVLAVTSIPGALTGAYLTTIIPARTLGLIFGVFLILAATRILLGLNNKRKNSPSQDLEKPKIESDVEMIRAGKTILTGALLAFFGGLASGLLGIGGGVLMVPIMTFIMGIPIHCATATSHFTMIFTSVSGTTQHYFADHIVFEYALLLAAGTVIGAQVGAYASKRVSGTNLRRIFGIVLFLVSIQMIIKHI